MATTTYIKRKNMRNLDMKNFRINKVYNFYRDGGLEVNGKYLGKTFVNIPNRIKDKVILQGDEQLKYIEGDVMELRESIWNKETKQREFHKYTGKFDKEFYATYKKVYDVEVTVKEEFDNPVWDKEKLAEVNTTFSEGTTATLNSFPVGRLRGLLEALDLDSSVELVPGKSKDGKDAMIKPYDWEDGVKNTLEGKFVSMRVRGTGLDTTYSFKEVPPFLIAEDIAASFEDEPIDTSMFD